MERKHKKAEIGTEHTDSATIVSFINQNREYKPFRKKMLKFYGRRNYQLAWSEKGVFLPQASMFVNLLPLAYEEGVKPARFKGQKIRDAFNTAEEYERKDTEDAIAMRKYTDLLLSAAYFKYSRDIWKGTIDPDDINWHVDEKKVKYGKTLDFILESDEKNENPFVSFGPLHPEYNELKKKLAEYREMSLKEGAWPVIELGKKKRLVKGDTSGAVIALKKRLIASKDLRSKGNQSNLFDEETEEAVKVFQWRHGLKEDGIVGGETLRIMNISLDNRIRQIILNMERWRWVPKFTSSNYLMINIPEYKLYIYENDKVAWDMNVIVGKAIHNTPIFNDEVEYVVMSPHWNVPKSIALNEIIPILRRNPAYLDHENMEVFYRGKQVSPYGVSWANVNAGNYDHYMIRQRPGASNALGWVKFLFPNNFNVYLHDTPMDHLFSQQDRGFSHGCIRLEEPVKLAHYLLRNDPDWTPERIEEGIYAGKEKFVRLKKKVPVYIVYFTTWIDDDGIIHFREDIYGHDKRLAGMYFTNN